MKNCESKYSDGDHSATCSHNLSFTDASEMEDHLGVIEIQQENAEIILTRHGPGSMTRGLEMLRYNQGTGILSICPKIIRNGNVINQFDKFTELQIENREWDPNFHSELGDRSGLLRAVGLPRSFSATYEFGLGIKREYRSFVDEIEKHTSCNILRFVCDENEGISVNGDTFDVALKRLDAYRAIVDRNRGRGQTAVRRVLVAESHNSVADLFGLDRIKPKYTKNEIIKTMTEAVAHGYVVDASDRASLMNEMERAAPTFAREAPKKFKELRTDIELVSLEVLIDEFRDGLSGRDAKIESYWQHFFDSNRFALQQLFAMPLVVERPQAHLRGPDLDGQGERITDFLCANSVTRSAIVVEIKTPNTPLTTKSAYRGAGSAVIFPPSKELAGSISQVQSQMESLPRDLGDSLLYNTKHNINPWNEVSGAIIVGMYNNLSTNQRESFLRFRSGLKNITILGYDEVLERLESLLSILKTHRA